MIPAGYSCDKYKFINCIYVESKNRVPYYLYSGINTLDANKMMKVNKNENIGCTSAQWCSEQCDKQDTCTGG